MPAANLEKSKSDAKLQQTNLVRSSLSFLDAVERQPTTFAEENEFCRNNGLIWFINIYDTQFFIPKDTPPEKLIEAAHRLQPPSIDERPIRRALYELWITTKHERMTADDKDALLKIFSERLCRHNETHVAIVLTELSKTQKFFPAWAEIEERLARYTGEVATLYVAIQRTHAKLTGPQA